MSLVLWLLTPEIIAVYLDRSNPDNLETTQIALSLLRIVAIAQGMYGLHFITIGLLQGLQDTLASMWINIIIYWAIGLGGSYFVAIVLNESAMGIWLALSFAIIASTGILLWRFFSILPQQNEN